jgi:hypothetical protein
LPVSSSKGRPCQAGPSVEFAKKYRAEVLPLNCETWPLCICTYVLQGMYIQRIRKCVGTI